jgi:hypothetical protein
MPDPHKTFGQHMQQKAAYKLDGIYQKRLKLRGFDPPAIARHERAGPIGMMTPVK